MQNKEKINSENCYNTKLKLIQRPLLAFAKSRVSNKEDAEDIAQKCLSILSQKREDYDSNKNWCAWAFRICSFQIKAYFSKRKRNKVLNILNNSHIHMYYQIKFKEIFSKYLKPFS